MPYNCIMLQWLVPDTCLRQAGLSGAMFQRGNLKILFRQPAGKAGKQYSFDIPMLIGATI